jgi:hypothetical protein
MLGKMSGKPLHAPNIMGKDEAIQWH